MRPGGVKIDGFELLFIYNGGEYSDPFELATITVNDDISYTFQVDSEDWGTWSGSGGFSNCGPTTDSGTGCFRFSNPFGNLAVTSIKFQATSVTPRPLFANDSDYSLGELSVQRFSNVARVGARACIVVSSRLRPGGDGPRAPPRPREE